MPFESPKPQDAPRMPSEARTAHLPEPLHRLDLARIAEAASVIDPVFLHSPQLQFETLSAALGCHLTVKVETLNPVRCFKGRGADYLVAKRVAAGLRGPLVCASAGNFGQAMAYACRKHDIALTVFASVNANPLKVERMHALGAQVMRAGEDFDAAKDAARAWAQLQRMTFVEDGAQPEISEGAGSIAVELLRNGAHFDALVLPLGNGALLAGVARWTKAHARGTRITGVCSSGAPAMAVAWRAGPGVAPVSYADIRTIADGIAVRVPIAQAVADLRELVDDVLVVDDDSIVRAMRLVHEHAGLVVEPSGAVGVAAILSYPGMFAGASVATVLTGAGMTRQQIREHLVPSADTEAQGVRMHDRAPASAP